MNVFDILREKLDKKKKYFQKFYETEGKTKVDADLNKATQLAFDDAIEIVNQVEQEYNNGWIPVCEHYPESNTLVLLSFENIDIQMVGMYEADGDGGAFYLVANGKSCISCDLFVNAWKPLPAPFREDNTSRKQTNADRIRSMTDEELADAMIKLHIEDYVDMQFCKNSNRCNDILDSGEDIPEGMCRQCLMEWLQKEVE